MSEPVARDGFVPVTGGRVWFHEARNNEATPILRLHGGSGVASDHFGPLEAVADKWSVVRYERPGGGRSGHPEDVSFWPADRFAEEPGQVRQGLNLIRAHPCGRSWGSALAAACLAT